MRLCQFNDSRLGLVKDGLIHDVSSVLAFLPAQSYPFPNHDVLIANLSELRERILAAADSVVGVPIGELRLLSPVANPGKIVAAPVNYTKHLAEAIAEPETYSAAHVRQIHETGLFLKATSSVIGPSAGVTIIHPDRRTDHEVELAVVIGKPCKQVRREQALDYVAGYCIGLDITIRGPEERSLRKSLDTYTVLGPWMVTADEMGDPSGIDLMIDVNGSPRQRANTRDLILDVPALIEFASAFYTLLPGDVLLTGTPEGVGPIQSGDEMHARIERIGDIYVQVQGA